MDNYKVLRMEIPEGVLDLVSAPDTPKPPDNFYTFEGDLCQMLAAAKVARDLGFKVGVVGGYPYVLLKEEYDKVVQYIIDNQIEGYWHYKKYSIYQKKPRGNTSGLFD